MAREIRESDWKILRALHAVALERFCQRVLSEVAGASGDVSRTSHQRYLAVYEIIQSRDKEMADVFNNLRRSTAFLQLASLRSRGLLESEEFSRFSDETRSLIDVLLDGRR